jgi:hypothetical protein
VAIVFRHLKSVQHVVAIARLGFHAEANRSFFGNWEGVDEWLVHSYKIPQRICGCGDFVESIFIRFALAIKGRYPSRFRRRQDALLSRPLLPR